MDIARDLGEFIPNLRPLMIGLAILFAVLLASSTVGLYMKLAEAMKIFAQKPKLSLFLLVFYLGFIFIGGMLIWTLVKGWIPQ
jgi:hypothetical protein